MPPRPGFVRPTPVRPAAKWDEVKKLRLAYDRAVRQEVEKQASLEQAIKDRAYRAAIPQDKLEDAQAASREVRRCEMEYDRYLKTHVMPANFGLDFKVEVYGASRLPRSHATEFRVRSVDDIWSMQSFYDSPCFDETVDMINALLVSQGGSYPGVKLVANWVHTVAQKGKEIRLGFHSGEHNAAPNATDRNGIANVLRQVCDRTVKLADVPEQKITGSGSTLLDTNPLEILVLRFNP